MKKRITFVGLDPHKNSIEVALANNSRNTEVRLYGTIGGDLFLAPPPIGVRIFVEVNGFQALNRNSKEGAMGL